jgi:outer membrane protein insertion porin family
VLVKVDEMDTGQLILGFGVTSGFGIIGSFRIRKKNFDLLDTPDSFWDIPESFTGAGQTLIIDVQPGTDRSMYRFNFTEPYIFDTRNALTLSGSKLTIIRDDYDEDRLSFSPSISHAFDFDRDFVFVVGYRIEEVQISALASDASPDVIEAEGYHTVSAVKAGISYDKTLFDMLEGAYDGNDNALYFEYAGGALGGSVDYYKGEITNRFFYPLYTIGSGSQSYHHIISLANHIGIIEPHESGDKIPIFERFFLGGPNTVRGFRFRGLGPQYEGNAQGGTAMLWGNVEYSLPIFQKFLRGVAFFDYGNLSPTYDDFDWNEMRFVVGGGVRITVPLFGQPFPAFR